MNIPILASATEIGYMDALLVAVGGYGVVFAGLIVLMVVVILVGKCFSRKKAEKKPEAQPAAAAEAAAVEAAPVAPAAPMAPGSAGQLKMHDVPPKTAAMLMAIVAHKMNKPLNELRFISIKEVK